MTSTHKQSARSLYDFGPMAEKYENWYDTPEGQECDWVQQQDVLELLGGGPHQGKLLDVGCGTGHWSRFFSSLGFEVRGVDLSEEMIRVARKNDPDGSYKVANACDLPFQEDFFDVVITMASLEFVSDSALALREMIRCVKPGGKLIVGTLNRLAPLNRKRLSNSEEPYVSGHLLTPWELWDLLSPLGCSRMVASASRELIKSRGGRVVVARSGLRRIQNAPFLVAEVQR